jgi:hypothetical protein
VQPYAFVPVVAYTVVVFISIELFPWYVELFDALPTHPILLPAFLRYPFVG